MSTFDNTWAIMLAGGEGSQLRSLTTTALGVAVPKQFCSLRGGNYLLLEALKRAEAVAPIQERASFLNLAMQHARLQTTGGASPERALA